MIKSKPAALVTGGAKRIGAAFVNALVEDGHRVVIHYNHSKTEAITLANDLNAQGGEVIVLQADLSNAEAASKLIAAACEVLDEIGILVNSASMFEPDRLETLTAERFTEHMMVNLLAPSLLSQAFAQQSIKTGLIVNLLDYKLFNLNADYMSYTLSKAGLKTLTEILARSLSPRIRVNGIAPGLTFPNIHHEPDSFEQLHNNNPLNCGATPNDLVRALRFFCDTPSISGQTLCIDGGQHFDPRLNRDVFDAL